MLMIRLARYGAKKKPTYRIVVIEKRDANVLQLSGNGFTAQLEEVARGDFNGRILHCPAHGWVFNGRDGTSLQPCGWALKEYPLRITGGMVQVDVAAEEAES